MGFSHSVTSVYAGRVFLNREKCLGMAFVSKQNSEIFKPILGYYLKS